MNRRTLFQAILVMVLLMLLIVNLSQARTPEFSDAVASDLGTAFTYQGQLVYNGAPVNDTCDFTFSLWDEAGSGEPPTGGNQINSDVTITGVAVSDGLFTASLDFGVNAFNGEARWLQIRVNCGDGATTLAPRQPLTPAPHALSLPGLYTHQDATSPSLIGGYSGNQVTSGVVGAVISGGGDSSEPNLIHDDYGAIGGGGDNVTGDDDGETYLHTYATVGGGYSNTASGEYATVGGGYENTASHGYATVGGGVDNTSSDYNATVGGGESNTASRGYAIVGGGEGNTASGEWATVGGGFRNIANGSVATVGGGESNSTYGDYSTVGGGLRNTADATYSTIAGGGPSDTANPDTTNNRVYDDYGTIGGGGGNVVGVDDGDTTLHPYATLGGGRENTASGKYATVGGGWSNTASNTYATVGGGDHNTASIRYATVGGGENNTASGTWSTVAGGYDNTASGDTFSTVAGGGHNTASGNRATVGGGYYNTAAATYATIAGGGSSDTANPDTTNNRVHDDYGAIGGGGGNVVGVDDGDTTVHTYATVGGGGNNIASANRATVGGGEDNAASGDYATVGGGWSNTAGGYSSTVSGGQENRASGNRSTVGGGLYNTTSANYATIAGGGPSDLGQPNTTNNRVYDDYGAIGGGGGNVVGIDDGDTSAQRYATVSGGKNNTASSIHATVGGGYENTASGSAGSIGGGQSNTATGGGATIGGGVINTASGDAATVGGGYENTASGSRSMVSGGYGNTASGNYSTVPGGQSNNADGDHSFAAGHRTDANNAGCFVWGDSSDADVSCNTNDRTIFRSSGGFYIYSKSDLTAGIYISTNGNSWNSVSDRARKKNLQPVDTQALLDNLAAIDISTWNYKSQDPTIRHIGPMAQDFNALMPDLGGEGETYINTLDADGVALASIQGLYHLAQKQTARIEMLEAENTALQQRLDDLEARITASELTANVDRIAGGMQ